jgi:hypothetical protein
MERVSENTNGFEEWIGTQLKLSRYLHPGSPTYALKRYQQPTMNRMSNGSRNTPTPKSPLSNYPRTCSTSSMIFDSYTQFTPARYAIFWVLRFAVDYD